MKIILAHNAYQQVGGEDIVLKAEERLLQRYGNEVLFVEVTNKNIRGLSERIRTALLVSYSSKAKKALEGVIREFEPDIVHVHNFFPLLTPSIYDACQDKGVPVVQTLHNYRTICPGGFLMRDGLICEDCVTGSAYNAVLHGCYRNSRMGSLAVARMVEYHRNRGTWQKKVNRYIALTEFAKQKFVQAGFPSDKIVVKPNFVVSNNSETVLLKSDEPYALFVGRLSKEKGIETLLNAWEYLSLTLHLVGDGPLLNKVRSIGSNSIACFGRLSSADVGIQMSRASFLVMPSEWYEGFPMVLVEAYAHGLPVVASRLGSMAEIVEDGRTGLHFEAGNYLDLAEKVRWMQSHPEACKEMGENARRIYMEKYAPEVSYKKLMQIYREAIEDRV